VAALFRIGSARTVAGAAGFQLEQYTVAILKIYERDRAPPPLI
jgi:hypothetical protein